MFLRISVEAQPQNPPEASRGPLLFKFGVDVVELVDSSSLFACLRVGVEKKPTCSTGLQDTADVLSDVISFLEGVTSSFGDATASQTHCAGTHGTKLHCGTADYVHASTQYNMFDLLQRLYGMKTTLFDYESVPTTVFTPLEYGCVGLSEEAAIEKYTNNDIEVYHIRFQPLEWELSSRSKGKSFAKLVCRKSENVRVLKVYELFIPT